MNLSKVFRSFFVLFVAFIVSGILSLLIMGKDAYLLGGTTGNQITIVTPEYRKMQWDAMMAHPMLVIPALIVLAAVGYFLYNFWLVWKNFGAKRL